MSKREDHKEVAYLKEPTQKKLEAFKREHPAINSKSRIIENALEFYFAMAERYGLDEHHQPQIKDGPRHVVRRPQNA